MYRRPVNKPAKESIPVTFVDFVNRYHKTNRKESTKLAYLAGLVDGEGHVKVEKWGTIRLVIGMTDYKAISWCQKSFGGSLYRDQFTKTGKKFFVWRMGQTLQVFKLFILLYPFLITKKHLVLDALEKLKKRLLKNKDFEVLKGLHFN